MFSIPGGRTFKVLWAAAEAPGPQVWAPPPLPFVDQAIRLHPHNTPRIRDWKENKTKPQHRFPFRKRNGGWDPPWRHVQSSPTDVKQILHSERQGEKDEARLFKTQVSKPTLTSWSKQGESITRIQLTVSIPGRTWVDPDKGMAQSPSALSASAPRFSVCFSLTILHRLWNMNPEELHIPTAGLSKYHWGYTEFEVVYGKHCIFKWVFKWYLF